MDVTPTLTLHTISLKRGALSCTWQRGTKPLPAEGEQACAAGDGRHFP